MSWDECAPVQSFLGIPHCLGVEQDEVGFSALEAPHHTNQACLAIALEDCEPRQTDC